MKMVLFICALLTCITAQAAQIISFERGELIWIANLDGSNAKKLTKGSYPQISPDGKYIAFNIENNTNSISRFIKIMEITSGKIKQLKNIPTDNSFNPTWSPDSKKLLFNTFVDNDWHLALINSDDSGYELIQNTKGEFSPAWAIDNKSFFSHDLETIYWMDIKGNIIKKWPLKTIIGNADMSSASRIQVSPDGKKLIMDIDMREIIHIKNWDEPPPALWMYNIVTNKSTRLTPKGLLAWSPFWINSEDYVFTTQKPNEKNSTLYRGSIKYTSFLPIINNVRAPSISR